MDEMFIEGLEEIEDYEDREHTDISSDGTYVGDWW